MKKIAIELNPTQQQLFRLLNQFRNDMQLSTIMRVAGGWVRDKIMHKDSNDIDITLDNMTGQEFVKMLEIYFQKNKPKGTISGFGVTKYNPQKSKHLETAAVKINNQWIDFVNLRTQHYVEQSRIPKMNIGSAKIDAQRRDLTINSLFYNIVTQEIEDWTGLGLIDIQNKIIRTPLEPIKTFLDDPLRVLRAFRFSCKFEFKLDTSIIKAVEDQQIRQSLRLKVSKQRYGKQLLCILKCQNPYSALQNIYRNKLWNIVFQLPQELKVNDKNFGQQSLKLMNQLYTGKYKEELLKLSLENFTSAEIKKKLDLACIIYPYKNYQTKIKKKNYPLIVYIIQQSVKLPNKEAQQQQLIVQNMQRLEKTSFTKMEIVKWIRQAKKLWQFSLLMIVLTNSFKKQNLKRFYDIYNFIYNQGLQKCYEIKPLIDGSQVINLYELGKGVPLVKTILQKIIEWQIQNPKGTKTQLIQLIKNKKQTFM